LIPHLVTFCSSSCLTGSPQESPARTLAWIRIATQIEAAP
jgi:hypothetical protein